MSQRNIASVLAVFVALLVSDCSPADDGRQGLAHKNALFLSSVGLSLLGTATAIFQVWAASL